MSRFERLRAACREARSPLSVEIHVAALMAYAALEHAEAWWLFGGCVFSILLSVNSIVWHWQNPGKPEGPA